MSRNLTKTDERSIIMDKENTIPLAGQKNARERRKIRSSISVFERLYGHHTVASAAKRAVTPRVSSKLHDTHRRPSIPRKSGDFIRLHQHHTKASFSQRAYATQSIELCKIVSDRPDSILLQRVRFYEARAYPTAARIVNVPLDKKILHLDRFFGAMAYHTAARIVNVPFDPSGCTALHRVILQSQGLAVVEKLLHFGANVNKRNKFGRTPLWMLVTKSTKLNIDHDIFDRLVEARADVHLADINGTTPLHAICSEISRCYTISIRDLGFIKKLVHQGPPGFGVNLVDNRGCTALHYICNRYCYAGKDLIGQVAEIVRILIEAGAEVKQRAQHNTREDGMTPLHNVIDIEIAKHIIQTRHEVVNIACGNGDLPLHTCLYGSKSCGSSFILDSRWDNTFQRGTKLAAYLIYNGADLMKKNHDGARAIDIIAKVLQQPSDQIDFRMNEMSVGERIIQFLRVILPAFSMRGVTTFDDNNSTALHLACQHGHDRCIIDDLFLRSNDDTDSFVNAVDNNGKTALHYAVARESGAALACAWPFFFGIKVSNDKLFPVNTNVNIRDNNLQTPLHLLFLNSSRRQQNVAPLSVNPEHDDSLISKIMKQLLDKDGVDVLARDKFGMTPLQWAAIVTQHNPSKTGASVVYRLVQHPSFLSSKHYE